MDDGEPGRRARGRLRGERLSAPELIDLEVVSVLRRLDANGRLATDRARKALVDLHDLRLTRVGHRRLLPRCWELRPNLAPYDAAYVALAELLGAPLVTADARLARAPTVSCPVEILR